MANQLKSFGGRALMARALPRVFFCLALTAAATGCGLNSDKPLNSGTGGLTITAQTPPGVPSQGTSTISASPTTVAADGVATATVDITIKDSFGNPIPGVAATFAASGAGNTLTQPSDVTNSAGVARGHVRSTSFGTKILTIASPASMAGVSGSVRFYDPNPTAANCLISGTDSITADGVSTSTITIVIRNSIDEGLPGFTPTFSATNTGGSNVYTACSVTDSNGVSTCTLASQKAEIKTLQIQTPVVRSGGTVTFVAGPPVAANSTITATPNSNVTANGSASSTVTITLRDQFNNPVSGASTTFASTGSGNTLTQPGAVTNASGQASGTIQSTVAQTKTLNVVTPAAVSSVSTTVTFVPGPASTTTSTISASPATGTTANGSSTATVTITLRDANGNAISGVTPTFASTGSGNTLVQPGSATNGSGQTTGTIASTVAESKTLSISSPAGLGTVTTSVGFSAGAPVAGNSSISASPAAGVTADGSTSSTVTITLRDAFNNPVPGANVAFASTGTNNTLTQPALVTNASGQATGSIVSTKAESKTLSISAPAGFGGVTGTVTFVPGAPSTANSSISASPATGVTADGATSSTVTITLRDAFNNPISGTTVGFASTGTNNTLTQPGSTTNASGQATGSIVSTKAETKTLSISSPAGLGGVTNTVDFVAGAPSAANSSISASPAGGIIADGSSTSTVTITIRDAFNNPVSGANTTFSSTGTGNTLTQPGTATNASGVATGTISSSVAETKTLAVASPAGFGGVTTNVTFIVGAVSSATSSITGTGPVVANGVATSTVTITLRDATNNPAAGITPTFDATDTDAKNSYGACSATDASGVSTCTLSSTRAEAKTLRITSPITKSDGTVSFTPGAADPARSSISVSPASLTADGVASATVTMTIRDANDNPISGVATSFASTGTGNTLTQPGANTNASGQATGSIVSTKAESKTLSISAPAGFGGVTTPLTFVPGAASAANSSIAVSPASLTADGVASSTVTITIRDANNNPISGVSTTFASTGTNNTLTQPGAPTNASGQATGSIVSTKAEAKTLSIATPAGFGAVTVGITFVAGTPVVANSTISASPSTNVTADGATSSTVTITLRDAFNNPVSGVNTTFASTGTGNTLTQPGSATNASGQATGSIVSTKAETKTLSIATPAGFGAVTSTVDFVPGAPLAANSSISASPNSNVTADGTTTSTVTITLRDANNNPVSGVNTTFASTGSGNTLTQPGSATDASGQATGTIKSTVAESKTISIATPAGFGGVTATVGFVAGAPALANSTISASPNSNVTADGTTTSTITITLRDANNNPVSGVATTFASTGSGNTLTQPASNTNASGQASGTIKSTVAESKTVSITSPAGFGSVTATVGFVAGPPDASSSTISASPASGITADGVASSTITVTLRDAQNNPISGTNVTLSASGSGNTLTQPGSATNASGQTTGTIKSTMAQTKTLSITSPAGLGAVTTTVGFVAGAPSASTSSIAGSPSSGVTADGSTTSTVTITLRDATNNPVSGVVATFASTGTSNTLSQPGSVTNASGQASGAIASTKAETKTLSISDPAGLGAVTSTVAFVAGPAVAANSSISASPTTVYADGTQTSTITITLRDAFSNPVIGTSPTFAATGTGNTLIQPGSTNASGQATGTIASTVRESKTLTISSPAGLGALSSSVTFIGWNLEIPIELLDAGVTSTGGNQNWERSETTLDTSDYDGTVSYVFEAVCTNGDPANAETIRLRDSLGNNYPVITVPANTATPTRFSVAFTPAAGLENYRVRTSATVGGALVCHSARILVRQTNAFLSKVYIPLVSGQYNQTDATTTSAGGVIDSTVSTTYGQTVPARYAIWRKDLASWGTLDAASPWTLETVASATAPSSCEVAFYNKTTNAAVTGALTTTATTLARVSTAFSNAAANFTDLNDFEVRIRTTGAGNTCRLHKAGLWVKLSKISKAEVYYRISKFFSLGATTVIPHSRALIDLSRFSNPDVYFEATGSEPVVGTSDFTLLDDGANDSGTGGSTIASSNIDFGSTTKARVRTGLLSITSGDRYIPRLNWTSGTFSISNGFVVIYSD